MPATVVKVEVKLKKSWTHGDDTFQEGTILNVDENTAKRLVASGVAAIYDPEAEKAAEDAELKRLEEMEKVAKSAAASVVEDMRKELTDDRVSVIQVKSPGIGDGGGFDHLSQFCKEIYLAGPGRAPRTPALKRWMGEVRKTNMVEGDDAQGGFLVPTEHRNELLQTALEETVFARHARFIPMATNRVEIPAMFDINHSGDTPEFFGGVTVYRPGEGEQKTKSKPTFGMVQLNLHKTTGLIAVSEEMLEDSPISIGPILQAVFGSSMGWVMDDDTINGDGVGKPLGFLNCNALVVVLKEAAQADDTIIAENVLNMYARMYGPSKAKAIWIANPTCLKELATMVIGNMPVFIPAGGLSQRPFDTLLGRPLYWSEKMAALGSQGDIAFVDPLQYLLGGKNGLTPKTATSIHLYFDYDLVAFRFVLRYDGTCWWKTSFTPKNGDTQSPYVVLGDRKTL